MINFNDPLRRQSFGMMVPVVRLYDLSLMSNVAAPDFFARILRESRGGELTTGLMDLIVLSVWLSNMLVEEIPDTREKRTIEVKFLLLFAEIRHVSLWQTFRNSV